jgi:hypothetical protein
MIRQQLPFTQPYLNVDEYYPGDTSFAAAPSNHLAMLKPALSTDDDGDGNLDFEPRLLLLLLFLRPLLGDDGTCNGESIPSAGPSPLIWDEVDMGESIPSEGLCSVSGDGVPLVDENDPVRMIFRTTDRNFPAGPVDNPFHVTL